MSSKATHACILASGSVSITEEGFHQGPAAPLMHKFISVLLPSSGQMSSGVWWKWGKLSVLQAVHFCLRDVVLGSSLCFTEDLPNFFLVQKWHEQGKKGKKPVSCLLPPEWCQELIMRPVSYAYAMAIVWIQEFIEHPRWEETIPPAIFFISLSSKSRITLTAGDCAHWAPPHACSKWRGQSSEEAQSHWKGFCISMWWNYITHSGRKGLNPFRLSLGAEPSCSLFCSPSICRLNHWEDFPRLIEHLLVVAHILWQQVPQLMWLRVKKIYPLQEINLPVKDSDIFVVWKPFHSMDTACWPFFLHFNFFFVLFFF